MHIPARPDGNFNACGLGMKGKCPGCAKEMWDRSLNNYEYKIESQRKFTNFRTGMGTNFLELSGASRKSLPVLVFTGAERRGVSTSRSNK